MVEQMNLDEDVLNLKVDAAVINKALLAVLENFVQLDEASILFAVDLFIVSNWCTAASKMSQQEREDFFDSRIHAVKRYLDNYDNIMAKAMDIDGKKLGVLN